MALILYHAAGKRVNSISNAYITPGHSQSTTSDYAVGKIDRFTEKYSIDKSTVHAYFMMLCGSSTQSMIPHAVLRFRHAGVF